MPASNDPLSKYNSPKLDTRIETKIETYIDNSG